MSMDYRKIMRIAFEDLKVSIAKAVDSNSITDTDAKVGFFL